MTKVFKVELTLKEIDSLCTYYYEIGDKINFKRWNKKYHEHYPLENNEVKELRDIVFQLKGFNDYVLLTLKGTPFSNDKLNKLLKFIGSFIKEWYNEEELI